MLKKITLNIILVLSFIRMNAQERFDYFFSKKWIFDINASTGVYKQLCDFKYLSDYKNSVNEQLGIIQIENAKTYNADAEVSCFLGKMNRLGVGTGILIQTSNYDINLDSYHVEYENVDSRNHVYRQIISSSRPINENINFSSASIPIFLKYQQLLTTRVSIAADLGVFINIASSSSYKANAQFDYEAIYSYLVESNGKITYIYDGKEIPSLSDWLITKSQYEKNCGDCDIQRVFDSLNHQSYNVGLGINSINNSGKRTDSYGSSMGIIFRPGVNIRLSDIVGININAFYCYQVFQNNSVTSYRLVDNHGENYNSVLNSIRKSQNASYGISLGLRVFLGLLPF